MCNQLRMAIETFQNKYQQKLQDSRDSKNDFDTKIDIQ
jgi:hypothetical protein